MDWVFNTLDFTQGTGMLIATLVVVVLAQVLGGAGLAAGVTVGALLAQQMLGNDGLAGLPTGLFTVGSAAAAFTAFLSETSS